jgi:hypothetical protein
MSTVITIATTTHIITPQPLTISLTSPTLSTLLQFSTIALCPSDDNGRSRDDALAGRLGETSRDREDIADEGRRRADDAKFLAGDGAVLSALTAKDAREEKDGTSHRKRLHRVTQR